MAKDKDKEQCIDEMSFDRSCTAKLYWIISYDQFIYGSAVLWK